MPRYFFHVIDGREIIDNEGTELPGLKEARAEAIRPPVPSCAMKATSSGTVKSGT